MLELLRRPTVAVLLALLLLAGGAFAFDELSGTGAPDRTTVTVLEEDGSALGTVEVRVADTFRERYTGLSDTESLDRNEGMLFVHDEEGEYAYVMRDMSFPIDIVFVDGNGTITAIHHAPTEEPPLTRYEGRGKWVLEVSYEWTTDHGVEVGDRVSVQWPENGSRA